jgi:TldD protein
MKKEGEVDRRQFLEATAVVAAGTAAVCLTGCAKPAKPPVAVPPKAEAKANPAVHSALEAFGISEAQLRKVMARAMQNGGDFCDLYFQRSRINYFGLQDEAVNRASARAEIGLGVRVVRGVETGTAFTESLDEVSMLDAAAAAAAVASGGGQKTPVAFRVGRAASYYPVATRWNTGDTKTRVDLLMKLHGYTAAADKRVKKVNISYRDEEHLILVADSQGPGLHRLSADDGLLRLSTCGRARRSSRESNYQGARRRAGLEFFNDRSARARRPNEVVDRTTVLFDAVAGPVGELPGRFRHREAPASCCTKRLATGWRPISLAKRPRCLPT